ACAPGGRRGATLLALNLSRTDAATLRLRGDGGKGAGAFVATASDLLGDEVLLNGRRLAAGKRGRFNRELTAVPVRGRTLQLPPTSYAFVREPHARVGACGG